MKNEVIIILDKEEFFGCINSVNFKIFDTENIQLYIWKIYFDITKRKQDCLN